MPACSFKESSKVSNFNIFVDISKSVSLDLTLFIHEALTSRSKLSKEQAVI